MDSDHTKNFSNTCNDDYTNIIIDSLRCLQETSESQHGHSAMDIMGAVRQRHPNVNLDHLQSQLTHLLYNAVGNGTIIQIPEINTLFKLNETLATRSKCFPNIVRPCMAWQSPSGESIAGDTFYCNGCTHNPRCQLTLPPHLRDNAMSDASDEDKELEETHPPLTCNPNTHPIIYTAEPCNGVLTKEVSRPAPNEGCKCKQQPSSPAPTPHFQFTSQQFPILRQQPATPVIPSYKNERPTTSSSQCNCAKIRPFQRSVDLKSKHYFINTENPATSCAQCNFTKVCPCQRGVSPTSTQDVIDTVRSPASCVHCNFGNVRPCQRGVSPTPTQDVLDTVRTSCARYNSARVRPCQSEVSTTSTQVSKAEPVPSCSQCQRRRPRPHTPPNSPKAEETPACSRPKRSRSTSQPVKTLTTSRPNVEQMHSQQTLCAKERCANPKCSGHNKHKGECVII